MVGVGNRSSPEHHQALAPVSSLGAMKTALCLHWLCLAVAGVGKQSSPSREVAPKARTDTPLAARCPQKAHFQPKPQSQPLHLCITAQSPQVGSRFLDLGIKQGNICLGAEEEEENRYYQKSLVSSALNSNKPALQRNREMSSPCPMPELIGGCWAWTAWRGAWEASQPHNRKEELGRRKNKGACKGDERTATAEGAIAWVGREGANWSPCPYAQMVSGGKALVASGKSQPYPCRREMSPGQGTPPPQPSPSARGPGGSYL